MSNYKNINQREGFDTDESMAIIKVFLIVFLSFDFKKVFLNLFQQLAKLHSICLAMRRQQPELFNAKVAPFTEPVLRIIDHSKISIADVSKN